MSSAENDPCIHPFRIHVPDEDVEDLRRRIAATRWPEEMPGTPWQRGVPQDYLRDLADAWRSFDWRVAEERLNRLPQYRTEIDGVPVHFVHVTSPEPTATPLVLTHGWPSSFVEFLDVLGPLTDPVAHGGDASDAFHVVLPTIPGYGFSGPVEETGWDVMRVAGAWRELMSRLGYENYVAAGGDWGSAISLRLGELDPAHVRGVHVTMFPTFPPDDPGAMDGLDEVEGERLRHTLHFSEDGRGYQQIQSTRPQTLAYGLTDSPVGQLAWIAEKYKEWTDSAAVPEDAVPRNHLLTQVSLFWFTASAASSSHIYVESTPTEDAFRATWGGPWTVPAPVGVAFFPADAVRPLRRWADGVAPTLCHWSEFEAGGHFPAVEQPGALVGDLRAFWRTARRTPRRPAELATAGPAR